MRHPNSLTGQYLSRRPADRRARAARREATAERSSIKRRARATTCKNVDVEIPLGHASSASPACPARASRRWSTTCCYRRAAQRCYNAHADAPGDARRASQGLEHLDKVIDIDQIADRPHAALEPGDLHRAVHADPRALRRHAGGAVARLQAGPLQLQRQGRPLRGLPGRRADQDRDALPARRLRALRGLPAASATTARRWRSRYKGKNIADVLDMTVERGASSSSTPSRRSRASCRRCMDVGLGYITLGQSATTLSGGEAQRVKLATRAVASAHTGRTLYILDEPTTGLHFDDIAQAARRAAPAGRPGQHGGRDRAQPRRDQDRRLDHRPRARGRRPAAARSSPRARPRTSSRSPPATPAGT